MGSIELRVANAYQNDSRRGIARLDPESVLNLGLSPGGIVEIEGTHMTTAQVWRADRQDWNTGIVRIDRFTRQNAAVEIDERVTIHKAEPTKADSIVLAPSGNTSGEFGPDTSEWIIRQLLTRPVTERDIVSVMSSAEHPSDTTQKPTVPPHPELVVVETDPDGVVLITQNTEINIRNSSK
jgi:transitional endoplasmic reticulum ATPase